MESTDGGERNCSVKKAAELAFKLYLFSSKAKVFPLYYATSAHMCSDY